MLSWPDRVLGIQGFAGSGKTTTLSVIRNAAETQGFRVEGFAPTSRAARQLGEAGVEAGTLQGLLARTNVPTIPDHKHFYFVDESSLASTKQVREFLSRLAPQDRVLLIGDTRQHQGVEAGRPFEQLQEAGMRTAKLDQIVRQKDPELKAAVEMFATGQVSVALNALQNQDRIREIPGTEERIRAIARSYIDLPERTLIVSPDNASRRELNVAVRQELKANGTLAPQDHSFRVLVQRQEMTGVERSWASRYEINDVIRYTRGSKGLGIEASEYGTVVDINSASNLLTVEKSTGRSSITIRAAWLASTCTGKLPTNSPQGIASSSPRRTNRLVWPIAISPSSSPSRLTAAFPPVSITTVKWTSMPLNIATSIMVMLLQAIAPKV